MSDLPEIDPVKSEVERISRIVAERIEKHLAWKICRINPMVYGINRWSTDIDFSELKPKNTSKHGKTHQVICGAYGPQGRRYSQNKQQEPLGL
jgi:hypothetical protein